MERGAFRAEVANAVVKIWLKGQMGSKLDVLGQSRGSWTRGQVEAEGHSDLRSLGLGG